MEWKEQPKAFKIYLCSMLAIVFLLGTSIVVLVFEQLRYQSAVDTREKSIKLAAELRQSSNDLTRLVRTYIITGNPLYKHQFQAVVEIRDGLRTRPKNYSLAYWDVNGAAPDISESKHDTSGDGISIIELIQRAGFTEIELQNLKLSKEKSDLLVAVENKAIDLFEENVPTDPKKREKALEMLADDFFISTKAEIMRPIIETEQMVFDRTQSTVNIAKNRLMLVIGSLCLLSILLIIFIFKIGVQLRKIIGCSIPELEGHLHELGKGNFLTPIIVKGNSRESVISWIARTQRKLAELNLAHFKAIVESSDDAIISKNSHGIIASWNRGAEKIFGYSEEEIIGQSMTLIIPSERSHEEAEILNKISSGQIVDHFVTQRKHKNGQLIDLSVSISPIYNSEGQVIGASKIARDISAAVAAEAEIKRLAFYDSLTGLANRRLLQERLGQLLLSAKRDKFPIALMYIDLDDFKLLNDTQGHEAGDHLLKAVSNRLIESVRDSDTVCRFGGDEFLIMLSGRNQIFSSDAWVKKIGKKIRERLSYPYDLGAEPYICTSSIGAYIYKGEKLSSDEIINKADQAMYIAKKKKNAFYLVSGNYAYG